VITAGGKKGTFSGTIDGSKQTVGGSGSCRRAVVKFYLPFTRLSAQGSSFGGDRGVNQGKGHMSARNSTLVITAALVLTVASVGGSAALAQAEQKGSGVGLLKVAADYIGLDRKALVAELREGQSLAQVATAQGKPVAGLKQALRGAVIAKLDQRLAGGTLTSEQRQQVVSRLDARIDRIVDRVWKAGERPGRAWKQGLMKTAAGYVGLTRKELGTELKAGKSLAQVAVAQGKSVEGLKQALLNAVKTRLDQLVANGELKADRREKLLSRIEAKIEKIVNRTRG
jgi:lambda repressor-like predicted transcriptional regulator